VAGAVNVSVVTVLGLILDVGGVDCDSAGLLFGSLVDLVIAKSRNFTVTHREYFGYSSGKGGFTMVDVTDGTNVNVRPGAFKMLLCHG
jgi:hypothetical protein